MDTRTAAFVAVAAVLVITPGPNFAVVVRNALRGRRQGFATSAGTVSGLLVHTLTAALGLSAVLAGSAVAFTVVKVVGALYLCWLGVRALASAGSHAAAQSTMEAPARDAAPSPVTPPSAVPLPARLAFRHGMLTNVLNPMGPRGAGAGYPRSPAHRARAVAPGPARCPPRLVSVAVVGCPRTFEGAVKDVDRRCVVVAPTGRL